jgi:cytoskeletal protein CcmA (bactofilin family)
MQLPERIATTLGKETSFNGRLSFTDSLKIDGEFEGEIDSTGFLYIAKGAVLRSNSVRAGSILVGGEVHGNLEAAEKIELLSSARVYGDMRTNKLRMADGVVFQGKCEMLGNADEVNIFSSSKEELLEKLGSGS